MLQERTATRPNDDCCLQVAGADVQIDGLLIVTLPIAEQQAGTKPRRPNRGLRQRHNEKIGGGYFIFRRGSTTGRIKTGHIRAGHMPFEHPSRDSAIDEAARLADLYGGKYDVFERVTTADGGPLKRRPMATAEVESGHA